MDQALSITMLILIMITTGFATYFYTKYKEVSLVIKLATEALTALHLKHKDELKLEMSTIAEYSKHLAENQKYFDTKMKVLEEKVSVAQVGAGIKLR